MTQIIFLYCLLEWTCNWFFNGTGFAVFTNASYYNPAPPISFVYRVFLEFIHRIKTFIQIKRKKKKSYVSDIDIWSRKRLSLRFSDDRRTRRSPNKREYAHNILWTNSCFIFAAIVYIRF